MTIPENEARTPTFGPVYANDQISSSTAVYVDCTAYIGRALEISAYGGSLYFAFVATGATAMKVADTTGFETDAALRIEPGETKTRVPQAGKGFLCLLSVTTPLADVRVGVSSDLVT